MNPHLQESFARIFATHPSVPKRSLNDDDVYIIDLARRCIVSQYGPSSARNGVTVKPGHAVLKGMQLRHSKLIDMGAA